MIFKVSKKSIAVQFLISVSFTLMTAFLCYLISDYIGYRSVALILLFSVSVLAAFFSLYPVLVSAFFSALIWDYFFIPPHFTFHVEKTEDVLMLMMYFIIALFSGILTSKIKQFEKQARKREDELKTLKLYDTLLNSVSHEIRTPITTVLGVADNLICNYDRLNEQEKKNMHEEILIAGIRLNKLVDNLLNVSRIESGFLQPKLDWCDVNEIVHSVINRVQSDFKNKIIKAEIPAELPLFKLDYGLIEQAIFNIVYNSAIHTPKDAAIEIKVLVDHQNLRIKISDNGQGIDEETMANLFKKFQGVEPKKTGGLGLGLSISHGFIQAHGGKITAKNIKSGGVEFEIFLISERILIEKTHE